MRCGIYVRVSTDDQRNNGYYHGRNNYRNKVSETIS